ncbi:MAG: hypothetical protein ABR564_00435 [Candidatus Dormibacteria bacterium]
MVIIGGGRSGCYPGGCLGMLLVSLLASVALTALLDLLSSH